MRSSRPLVLITVLTSPALAGPLTPPAGPVGPTHRTLTEVEPRTVISAATTPGDADATPSTFKITQPGSYFLAGNLEGEPGKIGIEIAASNVTLDLGGFTLTGANANGAPVSLDGIRATGPQTHRAAIRNGFVRGWGQKGVNLEVGRHGTVEAVGTENNAGGGFTAGYQSAVVLCTSSGDGVFGIRVVNGRIDDCRVQDVEGNGIDADGLSIITGCSALSTGGIGIVADAGSIVSRCVVASPGSHGIYLASSGTANTGGTIERCSVMGAGENGIHCFPAAVIEACSVSTSQMHGIVIGSHGIVRGCMSKYNRHQAGFNGAGICTSGWRARIEGNNVCHNDTGVLVEGSATRCLVVQNSAAGNSTANYSIVAGNAYGAILSTGGGAVSSSNAWANWVD